MNAAKDWETKHCLGNECPTTYGREIVCKVCEQLRRSSFRAGVRWVKGMFDANITGDKIQHNVLEEIKEELCRS